LSESNLICCRL